MAEGLQVKVGQGWWLGIRPVWVVDSFHGDEALLARWRPEGDGLVREEKRLPVEGMLAHDGGWVLAPNALVEEAMREIAAARGS